jgi:hypothetical protein
MPQTAFNHNPDHNYLGLFDNPKAVTEFLGLNKQDIARATSLSSTSIRFDSRMPEILKTRLSEIALICELVAGYFKGDAAKTALWFRLPNPMLGEISPRDMIRYGRFKKLYQFVTQSLEGQMLAANNG